MQVFFFFTALGVCSLLSLEEQGYEWLLVFNEDQFRLFQIIIYVISHLSSEKQEKPDTQESSSLSFKCTYYLYL